MQTAILYHGYYNKCHHSKVNEHNDIQLKREKSHH